MRTEAAVKVEFVGLDSWITTRVSYFPMSADDVLAVIAMVKACAVVEEHPVDMVIEHDPHVIHTYSRVTLDAVTEAVRDATSATGHLGETS